MNKRGLFKSLAIFQVLLVSQVTIAQPSYADSICEGFVSYASYVFEKMREVPYMGMTEIHLARLLRETLKTSKPKRLLAIPVTAIFPLHTLSENRVTVQSKLKNRIGILKANSFRIETEGRMTIALQDELIPSVTSIMVVRDRSGDFVTIEGNGRLQAIREAFSGRNDIEVEAYYYETDSPRVLELIERIRDLNSGTKPQ